MSDHVESKGATVDGELTGRQRHILEVIHEAVTRQGYPPSIREIGDAVGLTSTSSVHAQLDALQKKGYIRRDPTKPRAIDVYFERPAPTLPRPLPAYVPLVGQIAAGTPIMAEEHIEEVMPLPRDLIGQGEVFMLRVRGDSMIEAGVFDGDYVVVRQQEEAHNGEMVAAMIEGVEEEATVKRLSRRKGKVLLEPANSAYEPIDGDHAKILGKVVAVLRRL